MNIGGLIRSLVGDLQAAESKVLELKVGQVVKGLVLQLLSDQDALINIGGMQVRAKLETPLKQGEVTLLQVQPESNGSQIMLKPLASSDVQIADESMSEILKSFNLKDSSSIRQMMQQIQQEGVPLTKETAQAFAALQSKVPEGLNQEEWLQAAVLAFKRGLPLTQEVVSSLRQVIAGPPMGDVLDSLQQQAAALLQEQPTLPAADTLTKLVSALKELRATAAAALVQQPPESAPEATTPAAPQAGATVKASAPTGTPEWPSGGADAPAAARPAASPGEAASPASAAPRAEALQATGAAQPAEVNPKVAQTGATSKAEAQAQSAEPVSSEGESSPATGSPAAKQLPVAQEAASAAARTGVQSAQTQPPEPEPDPDPNWIGKLLKSFGFEHEHHLAKLGEKPEQLLQSAKDDAGLLAGAAASTSTADDAVVKPVAETLKSLLLQLVSSDDLPAPLKETAQQALQQITGQQLLLSSDRSSMFSHVTLFIPFMNGSGQQSAAVHIQSRTGKRGEVDATNCRLLFDLQMKAMGNTLVDVQVVNKIVSLQVHNDHPMVADLIEGAREEISVALNKVGYQFFSLKCLPYPHFTAAKDGDPTKTGIQDGEKLDTKSIYEPKPYKGVDLRV